MEESKEENFEVTIRVTVDIEEVKHILEANGYKEENEFIVEDIYLIPEEFSDIDKYEERRLLNMSVRIRSFFFDPETKFSSESKKEIVKKDKTFDDKNNLIKESKYVCRIKDINEAHGLLKSLGYIELLNIKQDAKTFVKDNYEITLSDINGRIYIEMEDTDINGNIKYSSPEEIIKLIKQYKIPHIEGEYFIQKAVDEIQELRNKRKTKN